jgi:hypothetical protein
MATFSRDDFARIAFAAILGVGGAILIGKNVSTRESILWWLIYVIYTGICVNDQEGRPLSVLAAASVASAVALFGVCAFELEVLLLAPVDPLNISGISLNPRDATFSSGLAWSLITFVAFASGVGIVVCAYARPLILNIGQRMLNVGATKLKDFERKLNLVVTIVGGLALLIAVITR